MAKSSKSSTNGAARPKIGAVGRIALITLGFYVLFVCWENHSKLMGHPSHYGLLSAGSGGQCLSVSVASSGKHHGDAVSFLLDGKPIDWKSRSKGISVVAIDPWRQAVIGSKTYKVKDDSSIAKFVADLKKVPEGFVILVGVQGICLKGGDEPVSNALRQFGSNIVPTSTCDGYALIGSKGGYAIGEGQGSSVHAFGLLPCTGEQSRRSLAAAQPQEAVTVVSDAVSELDSQAHAQPEESPNELPNEVATENEEEPAKQEAAEKPYGGDSDDSSKEASGSDAPHKDPDAASKYKAPTGPIEGSPETTFRCVGRDWGDRSCLFKNLYYQRGRFVMYVTKGPSSSIEVLRADKYEGPYKPDIEKFRDVEAIEKRLKSKVVLEERGLSVQFNPLFHHNIGHALFDGLYPAFFATVKLGVQDRPWTPIVAVDPGCFDEHSTGALKAGDLVEAYLPHEKHGRTLRAVYARVVSVPDVAMKDPECHWKKDFDHNGLDLGSEPVGNNRQACLKACAKTFGCKAGVLFADICYLKGDGGGARHNAGRWLCEVKGEKPKANIVVKPEKSIDGGEIKEVKIPEQWIVGQVRRRCMSEGIFHKFGMTGEIRRLFELERDCKSRPDLLIRFEEVVIGLGGAGNMVASPNGAIGGSIAPHNAMAQFRDRMLRAYDLPVPKAGVAPVPEDKELNIIVISNKRYTPQDRQHLYNIIRELNHKGGVKAEMIDWGRIGHGAGKFREHLKRTQKADVYVSSIGTALQYVPFMRDGKVYIALGSVWMRSGQYFPTFMEQQLAGGGTPYLRTLYADPGGILRAKKSHPTLGEDGYFCGVNGTLVAELMQQSQDLVRKGFKIPVDPVENLSVEGRILVEICKRDKKACDTMIHNRNGARYECAVLLWNECVVYEVGPWRKGRQCGNQHHKLLRQLRQEYGLSGYGAPSA